MAVIVDRIAFLDSLRGYRAADLGHDAVAGVLITATAIPLGVGFAQAAGLPPIVGLYTSMAPLVVYGLFGSSRHVKLGLDAAAAAMIGAVIVPLAANGAAGATPLLTLTALVSVLTGVILLIAGIARAGFLADLLSLPLLVGYQAGIGISVIIGQLPKLLGLPAASGPDLAKLLATVREAAQTHAPTALVGLSSLAVLVVLHRVRPRWPAALILLIAGTLVSAATSLSSRGVAVIGVLPSGLPPFIWPDVGLLADSAGPLLGVAASLALVAASDVVIASRAFAASGHYRVNANQDLAGLGLAQIAGGLSGAVPASASLVRTAIAERAGSRTQVSSVLGGLFMAVVVAWLTPWLSHVPIALLAAVCADACLRLIDIPAIRRLWRLRKIDALIAIATGVLVLASDPLTAIGAAVVFSLLAFLWRALHPDAGRLGRRRGIAGWFPLDDYADAEASSPDTVVFDWNGPLMFANAQAFADRITALARPGVTLIVVDCSAMYEIDASAIAALEELAGRLRARGVTLALAAPVPDAMADLCRAGLPATLGEGPHVFADIDTALAALGRLPVPRGVLQDRNGDGIYEYLEGE